MQLKTLKILCGSFRMHQSRIYLHLQIPKVHKAVESVSNGAALNQHTTVSSDVAYDCFSYASHHTSEVFEPMRDVGQFDKEHKKLRDTTFKG